MKNYREMTNFEINELVSESLLHKAKNSDARFLAIGNYCNSWADAGPILQEYQISLIATGDKWKACAACDYYFKDNNPLRSAMIVFLMMKEGK